jgi:K+-transporting ATPase ATPase C chain
MSFIRPALVLFILLTLLTGGVYPLLTTALGSGGSRSRPTAR